VKVVLSTIKQTNKQTIRVCFAGISIMLTFFLQDCYRLDVLKNLTLIDSYLLKKGRYLIGFLKINSSDDPDFLLKRPKCPVMHFYWPAYFICKKNVQWNLSKPNPVESRILYKLNTSLFWTLKLVPRRFGLDKFHCTVN
jgi:hypothetical protein